MKKTKKQKILAELHRLKSKSLPSPRETVQYSVPQPVVTPRPISEVRSPLSPKQDYGYITSGLRQTVVLTSLAICAQLVLWYLNGVKHWF